MPRKTLIQNRRDTASNWTSVNPILASGEIGVETNTNKFKIGNGTSIWTDLAYQGGSASTLDSLTDVSITGAANGDILVYDSTTSLWKNSTISSSSSIAYKHTQNVGANTWTINHNLGYNPNVNTADASNDGIEGTIKHTNINTLTVTFSSPTTGFAYLS